MTHNYSDLKKKKKSQVIFLNDTKTKHMLWVEMLKSLQIQKSASVNSHILWCETCSHRYSILQQPYSVHTINLTFYNQLNSAHLGVEGVGEAFVITYSIMWLV